MLILCMCWSKASRNDLPGVRRVKASYQKARMEVDYDETLISEAQIIAAVKQKGYEAIPISHEVYL